MRLRHFTVRGSGNFPVSLLHLSRAWPASMQDAEDMSYALPTQAPERAFSLSSHLDPEYLRDQWAAAKWPIQRIW
jgi:hypothetical protein